MLKELRNLKELDYLIEKENKIILIDFYANYCNPCKMIEPIFKNYSLNEELNKYIIFIKIDVDEAEDIAEKYNISSMPTFTAFYKKEKIKEFVGANPEKLKNLFIDVLNKINI